MTELEKMQRAKRYMDDLANGIDPISETPMDQDSLLNNVRLSRCFFYVSDVLRRVIENGGEVKKSYAKKTRPTDNFYLSAEDRANIPVSDSPAMISRFAESINGLIDTESMKKLKLTAFTAWLMNKGFLTEEVRNDKKRKIPTEAGKRLGISSEIREGQYGSYLATLYNREAQRFLVDNLDEIICISNGENAENRENSN